MRNLIVIALFAAFMAGCSALGGTPAPNPAAISIPNKAQMQSACLANNSSACMMMQAEEIGCAAPVASPDVKMACTALGY